MGDFLPKYVKIGDKVKTNALYNKVIYAGNFAVNPIYAGIVVDNVNQEIVTVNNGVKEIHIHTTFLDKI